jgi:glycosyl transferase family 4
MHIVYLAAGAAGAYCGACNRDVALVRELIARGHDVQLLPLYTPVRVEGADPSVGRVFMGGINAYLQQHSALFRHTPAFLDRWLDSPRLLRWVAGRAVSIDPHELGPMTVSVLQGAHGRQRKELAKLMAYLRMGPAPDVFNITNSLLSGLAPALRQAFGSRVVCSLQGEETFVAELGEPYADEALGLIRQNAQAIDLFIAPGEGYADEMAGWLGVARERIEVVHPGLDLAP